jgi:hypothetical protein
MTICSGWLPTEILLISAPRVARITGASHWHLAKFSLLTLLNSFLVGKKAENLDSYFQST